MGFSDTADGGIAGESADGFFLHGDQCRGGAHAGRGEGGFVAGVSGADHDDVKSRKVGHGRSLFANAEP
jgi:hypothetical protein